MGGGLIWTLQNKIFDNTLTFYPMKNPNGKIAQTLRGPYVFYFLLFDAIFKPWLAEHSSKKYGKYERFQCFSFFSFHNIERALISPISPIAKGPYFPYMSIFFGPIPNTNSFVSNPKKLERRAHLSVSVSLLQKHWAGPYFCYLPNSKFADSLRGSPFPILFFLFWSYVPRSPNSSREGNIWRISAILLWGK